MQVSREVKKKHAGEFLRAVFTEGGLEACGGAVDYLSFSKPSVPPECREEDSSAQTSHISQKISQEEQERWFLVLRPPSRRSPPSAPKSALALTYGRFVNAVRKMFLKTGSATTETSPQRSEEDCRLRQSPAELLMETESEGDESFLYEDSPLMQWGGGSGRSCLAGHIVADAHARDILLSFI